jgi:glucokinase
MNGHHIIADIGGTNSRFAVAVEGLVEDISVYPTADLLSIIENLTDFVLRLGGGTLGRISIAVAGPVRGQHGGREAYWRSEDEGIKETQIRSTFGCDRIDLMNDFAAQALSLPHLEPGDIKVLGPERLHDHKGEKGGTMAVLGPGTGLGVAGLVKGDHGRHIPIVGEGGHVDLAPSNDEEIVILKTLQEQFGHVSAERVISGPGLEALYHTLCTWGGGDFEERKAAEISKAASSGEEMSLRAIQMMSGWLGAVAGDLALTMGATGGVFVTGGVVPALNDLFDGEAFRSRFEDKGRFDFYVKAIPTWLITREHPALLGLARLGA